MVIVEWLGDGTAGIGTERRDEEGEKERCGGGGMISRCLGKRIGGGGMKGVGGTTKIGGSVGAGGRS